MKTIKYALALLFAGISINMMAQAPVALHHEGTTTLFSGATALNQAYTAAVNGDTLYLPGGGFTPPAAFQKSLKIYGAGFYPDSSRVASKTVINGNISFTAPVPNFYIEGVEITGTLSNSAAANKVDGLIVKNCKINGGTTFAASETVYSDNILLVGSVFIGNLSFSTYTSNVLITNCIIQGVIQYSVDNLISNNILLLDDSYNGNATIRNAYGNTIKNNIFYSCYISSNSGSTPANSIVNNNLVIMTPYGGSVHYGLNPINTDGNYYNTATGIPANTVFVNQTGKVFDYTHNYHLLLAAATNYLGTDGTQVGIYGGLYPAKNGWIPSHPYIQNANVSPETNSTGQLQLNFRAIAQPN